MTAGSIAITPEGLERLRREHEQLTGAGRAAIGAELRRACEEPGDLVDNAAYLQATEELGRLEVRIARLEHVLEHAEVVEDESRDGEVALGRHVVLRDTASGELVEYRLVGSAEVRAGDEPHLSNESPVGRAIAGRCKGETVDVAAPAGRLLLEIVDVRAA